jgi:hypothetical protein
VQAFAQSEIDYKELLEAHLATKTNPRAVKQTDVVEVHFAFHN